MSSLAASALPVPALQAVGVICPCDGQVDRQQLFQRGIADADIRASLAGRLDLQSVGPCVKANWQTGW